MKQLMDDYQKAKRVGLVRGACAHCNHPIVAQSRTAFREASRDHAFWHMRQDAEAAGLRTVQ